MKSNIDVFLQHLHSTITSSFRRLNIRRFKTVAGYSAVAISLVYIGITIQRSLNDLSWSDYRFSFIGGAFLFLGMLITLFLSASYHVVTVRRIEKSSASWLTISLGYSLGQIVRYLPGKIAGVMFQIGYLAPHLKASTVTIALISQTIYDNVWTTAFASAIIFGYLGKEEISAFIISTILFLILFSYREAWIERLIVKPKFLKRTINIEQSELFGSTHPYILPTAILATVWLPFIMGLTLYFQGQVSFSNVILLGACYLIASVGSMFVFVVPSGIIVREAFFLFIGLQVGLDATLLGYSGIVIRVALTLAELLCAAFLQMLTGFRDRCHKNGVIAETESCNGSE